ncbi:hypothetical protein Droror1_Dr00006740 [Drosera rotundifolia]
MTWFTTSSDNFHRPFPHLLLSPSSSPMPPTTTTAADTISGNESLLIEILLRIPARRLFKLTVVCKYWHHLISSPLFIHHHSLRRHQSPISGIFLYRWSTSLFHHFSFENHENNDIDDHPLPSDLLNDRSIKILQSCNGLLLCNSDDRFFVLNPTKGKSASIPPPPSDSDYFNPVRHLCLAFDPSHSPAYTIVSVSESISRIHRFAIRIYNPQSRNWRFAGDEFTAPLDLTFTGGVYWNRNIHWIGPRGSGLRFNLDREKILPMPTVQSIRSRKWRLFEAAGGGLYLVEIYGGACGGAWGSETVVVMEMGREYENWIVKYKVDLGAMMMTTSFEGGGGVVRRRDDACGGMYRAWHVMCVWKIGEEDLRLVVRVLGRMVWVCLRDGKVIDIGRFGKEFGGAGGGDGKEFDWVDVFPYVESPVCP